MKTILFLSLIALISIGAISEKELPEKIASFGAPVSSTGAPYEQTCATSGCHDTYAPNNGQGAMSITVEGAENGIEAGKTYSVTVHASDKDSRRFGYQLVALNDDDKSNAGALSIIDPERTQIITNELELKDRLYATYTYLGTAQSSAGEGTWTVQWTAPSTIRNVTFYASTVIANDDNTDFGDHVLTASRSFTPKVLSCINEHQQSTSWCSVPHINNGSLICSFIVDEPDNITVEVCDLTGRAFSLGNRKIESGNSRIEYKLPDISPGVYIIRSRATNKSFSQTIFLQ